MNLGASPMLLIADRHLICLVSILNVVVASSCRKEIFCVLCDNTCACMLIALDSFSF